MLLRRFARSRWHSAIQPQKVRPPALSLFHWAAHWSSTFNRPVRVPGPPLSAEQSPSKQHTEVLESRSPEHGASSGGSREPSFDMVFDAAACMACMAQCNKQGVFLRGMEAFNGFDPSPLVCCSMLGVRMNIGMPPKRSDPLEGSESRPKTDQNASGHGVSLRHGAKAGELQLASCTIG